jgi:hypothetical protein
MFSLLVQEEASKDKAAQKASVTHVLGVFGGTKSDGVASNSIFSLTLTSPC